MYWRLEFSLEFPGFGACGIFHGNSLEFLQFVACGVANIYDVDFMEFPIFAT